MKNKQSTAIVKKILTIVLASITSIITLASSTTFSTLAVGTTAASFSVSNNVYADEPKQGSMRLNHQICPRYKNTPGFHGGTLLGDICVYSGIATSFNCSRIRKGCKTLEGFTYTGPQKSCQCPTVAPSKLDKFQRK